MDHFGDFSESALRRENRTATLSVVGCIVLLSIKQTRRGHVKEPMGDGLVHGFEIVANGGLCCHTGCLGDEKHEQGSDMLALTAKVMLGHGVDKGMLTAE